MQTDDWPSHTEELSRKTLAELSRQLDRLEQGEIDARTMEAVCASLWHATSGLIEDGASETLSAIHKHLMTENLKDDAR